MDDAMATGPKFVPRCRPCQALTIRGDRDYQGQDATAQQVKQ